ncbi:MAG: late competence development ComFB family protein [Candidatus Muiribacteriota bacterium]|jgi:competence protein ComFB
MFKLYNVIEEIVVEKIRELAESDNEFNWNEKNILDSAAIALNQLPVKYIVTRKGEAYVKLEFLKIQYKVDIITEIIQAMEKVKKNP